MRKKLANAFILVAAIVLCVLTATTPSPAR